VRVAHSPDNGWNNGTSDEAARLASMEAAASSFAAAAEVGAEIIICHPNSSSQSFTAEDYDVCRARSVESLSTLAGRAAKAGLKMAVENMPARELPRPGVRVAELLDMIAPLGDGVGICLDTGHSNASGLDAPDEARRAGRKLLCVHIQDNDGKGEDQHLIPGEGTIDWDALVAVLDASSPGCARTFEIAPEKHGMAETLRLLAPLREKWEKR
jgi:sugar phosphate isomerase/epimerase